MAVELFANLPQTTISSGGTDAPAAGTQETWTAASSSSFPAVSSSATPPTQFHIADVALNSEIISVINISGTTWTVIRGAESTTPVAHSAGFTVYQVASAGALTQLASVDWLNVVTMFGADPTGTLDSTAAIQDALNAAPNGQPAYLPKGTYKTISPLTLPVGSVLLGDSAWDDSAFGDIGTTIKPSAAFTGTEVLYMADVSSAETQGSAVRNIAIDGSSLTVTADGIRAFGPVVKTVIENVTISSCTGWGINQLTDSGVASGNTCPYSWRATHVLVSNCATGGFNLPAMTDSTWTDVETIGSGGTSGHGFAITGAPSNSHFTNCRAEWTGTGDGWHLTGSWNTGTASGGFTMTGCSTDRNTQNGFYCNATGYAPVILSGCMFRRDGRNSKSGGGSYAGIQLSSASIPLIFTNVTVFPGVDDDGTGTNSPEYGVSFASSTFVQILSGYIQGATAGVNGTVSGSQLIAPNVIVASGTTGGPSTQLTDLYRQSSGIIQTDNDIQVPSGFVSALRYNASGITGATAASRYVGATTSGAPVSGTFITGDYIIDQGGNVWVCTSGGTQGTWKGIYGVAGAYGIFGDGSDGAVTLDGSTTYNNFSSLGGSTYTLTRDMFATSLTVNSGVTLIPVGYRIFCQGTVTNNGTISNNGNAGSAGTISAGTAGAATGSGANSGGRPGGAGSSTTGTAASGPTGGWAASNATNGTSCGGAGGTGTSGHAGGAGAVASVAQIGEWYKNPHIPLTGNYSAFNATGIVAGGLGGGGGGGDGTNFGGGGGGGAGLVLAFAHSFVNNATISTTGGAGGNGYSSGNCGGGGGGGGGAIATYTLATWTAGTTAVTGGSAGTASGTAGTAAVAGANGTVANVVVL